MVVDASLEVVVTSFEVVVGTCATRAREPGQVRKEAALSGTAHAQWGSLAGAKSPSTTSRQVFDGGCTVTPHPT